jgi:thiopeptide-type bacteriocin biosynthesis protein
VGRVDDGTCGSGATLERIVHVQSCLYTIAYLPRERIDSLLLDEFAPLALEIESHPRLDSLFFVRYSDPRWQLRFRVLGEPEWVRGPLRVRVAERLVELERQGTTEGHAFGRYQRELERYVGEEGMRLAERLFFLDSMAALRLLAAERRGVIGRSRREIALLVCDRLLDLAGFDERQRLAFYRRGYAWAPEDGLWSEKDRELLELRFRKLQPDLDRLLTEPADDAALWGGSETADIAGRFLEQARPVIQAIVEGCTSGRIAQDVIYLMWSYAHMFTNRMGIESTAEAISRYFMHRWLQERSRVTA